MYTPKIYAQVNQEVAVAHVSLNNMHMVESAALNIEVQSYSKD